MSIISLISPYLRDDEGVRIPLPPEIGGQLSDIFDSVIFDQVLDSSNIQWFDGLLRTYDRDFETLPEFPGSGGGPESFESIGDAVSLMADGVVEFSIGIFGLNDLDYDGVSNSFDAFPLDGRESQDFDGDGIGDNADLDDDNDRMPDGFEALHRFDPNDRLDADIDTDGDGATNFEEFLAGTFPGFGAGGAMDEQSVELFSPGFNKVMVKSNRVSAAPPVFHVRDVKFNQSAPSQTFDSTIGLRYEFSSDALQDGTTRFFIEENGQLPANPFLSKSFSGGVVTLDSREDFNPPIEDILAEVNLGVPLIDVPIVVQFLNGSNQVVDELRLNVSVVRLLDLVFLDANGDPKRDFAYNEDITARFVLNGINQAALNVTRFDVNVRFRADENSDFQEWDRFTFFPEQLQELSEIDEVEITNKAYQLTGQIQSVGEYIFTATAVVEDFQGEQPTITEVSATNRTLNITQAASGTVSTSGFDTGYLAFGSGGTSDNIYVAKLGPGNSVVGELEFVLQSDINPLTNDPTYNLVANPAETLANFDSADFINAGQILTNPEDILYGDINADGFGDLAFTNLPNGAPGTFV